MDKIQAGELIQKYNEGTASTAEIRLLENWYVYESGLQHTDPEDEDYLMVNREIWFNIQKGRRQKKPVIWFRVAVAASVLLCLGIGFYFYRQSQPPLADQVISKDFAPGKSSATLTLANGKSVVLTEAAYGTIASQSGIRVSKTADGELVYSGSGEAHGAKTNMNTLTTAKAEQYQVTLPDGTKVWLNAASSLKFPISFDQQKNRRVELKGEAYFEVTKDKIRPFIVATDRQIVEVLGTHFDISSYADDEMTVTTLLEGAVKVSVAENTQRNASSILKPGQQSVLHNNNRTLQIAMVDTKDVIAWKNGLFQFDNADIKTVMRQLSRWYNIEVEFSGAVPKETFSGKVYRNMSLSKVLDVLSFSEIDFKIEGRKMTINPGENK